MAARATLLLCLLVTICEGFDLQAAGVAAAGLAAQFHPTPDALGSFFSSSTLGLLVGAVIGGRLSDRIGRKRVLLVSIVLFGIFSALTACAWDMGSLTAARALTGLGLGGAMPNLIALMAESAPPGRRSASITLVYGGYPLGGAVVSLASLLMSATQWRWIFLIGGIAPLLFAPLVATLLPESRAFLALRAGTAVQGPADPALRGLGALLGQGRARWSVLLWISFCLELLILYLLLNWLPLLMHEAGLSRAQAAAAQIGFNLGGAVSALTFGQLLEGPARNLTILVTFIALPLLILALAHAPMQLLPVVGIVFALGCAVLAAQAFLYAEAPRGYPAAIRGIGVGVAVAFGRLGSVIGPKLAGALKAAGDGPSQLFMHFLPLVIAGSVCTLWLAFMRARPEARD